jgi:hypothetical protein
MNQNQQQQFPIKASDEALKGAYANMAQVAHTPEEFVVDFMNILPPAGILASRVIMSPGHFKRLLAAMQENLKNYEEKFGTVKAAEAPEKNLGFRTE